MEKITLDEDKLDELCAQMPEEAQLIFMQAMRILAAEQPVKRIKAFIKMYEPNNPVDTLLAPVVAEIIAKGGVLIEDDINKRTAGAEKTYHAAHAGKILITVLEEIIKNINERIVEAEIDIPMASIN